MMSTAVSKPTPIVEENMGIALMRRTAAALRGRGGRQGLADCLNEVMKLVPALQSTWLELNPQEASGPVVSPFSSDTLTLPLHGPPGILGVLRHPLRSAPLDAGRLKFLGAVADLVGATLDLAGRTADAGTSRGTLEEILGCFPVGAVCFSPERSYLAANGAALALLGGAGRETARLAALLLGGTEPGTVALERVVRIGPQVVLVHVNRGSSKDGRVVGYVALVSDIADKARAFETAVARETYRALWLQRPLVLAVLASSLPEVSAIDLARRVAAQFPDGSEHGPLEADACGVLLPEMTLGDVRARLRAFGHPLTLPGIRVGMAEVNAGHASPGDLLASAVAAMTPATSLVRPSLLLVDASPSVTGALMLALRSDCDAIPCNDREQGRQLLGERPFDAIFAKVELDEWDKDLEFLQRAIEMQPRIRPFVVTDAPGPYTSSMPVLPPGTPVFRKPFQVASIRQVVRKELVFSGS